MTDSRRATRPQVLVCDADVQTIRALRFILREAGFGIDATGTIEEALDHAAVHPPDAAIAELVLPDGDGVDLCRRLRAWSDAPLMFLTTTDTEHDTVRALDAGADDYLTKPFAPRELIARLWDNLRRVQRSEDEPRVEVEG